jgi:hypothetical protein
VVPEDSADGTSTIDEDNLMHVSTPVRRSLALLLVLAATSACSDATSAPRPAERPAFDIQALQPEASRSDNENSKSDVNNDIKAGNATLTIDPSVARTYAFGDNWIYFPAHSICDPATSGYGEMLWDAPCAALTKPITVTIEWSSKGGYAFARFTPELRFVPADSRTVSRWVVLSLHARRRLRDVTGYSVLYNSSAKLWIDESLADPTLCAWIDPLRNSVVRRVKHFSGYMVAAGMVDLGGLSDASY